MYYSTTDFLGLGNVSGTLVEENSVKRVILIETQPHEVVCPCCGRKTSRVHDYRLQDIKSLSYGGKNIYLRLRKRRYACQCGKRFYEKYSFVSKYNRMTNDVYAGIFNDCKTTDSYKSIAQKHNVSFNTVARVINFYDRTIYKCPEVLSIDEFKGNAGGNNYMNFF